MPDTQFGSQVREQAVEPKKARNLDGVLLLGIIIIIFTIGDYFVLLSEEKDCEIAVIATLLTLYGSVDYPPRKTLMFQQCIMKNPLIAIHAQLLYPLIALSCILVFIFVALRVRRGNK